MKHADRVSLIKRIDELESRLEALQRASGPRGVRRRSRRHLFGWPLWDIAVGPDVESGEMRGHARGVIAIGDFATGVLAVGGLARGVIAVGGIAIGAVSLAGLSAGLLIAVGGMVAGSLAIGGLAVGYVALGGLAAGYYACGGLALGTYVINAAQQDPEAVRFFAEHLSWLSPLLPSGDR